MFQRFRNHFRSLWLDPQRRFLLLVLGGFSLVTLLLCWYLPVLFQLLLGGDLDSMRFWLFLVRGLLLTLVGLVLLLYFQFRDLRRDWDDGVPWFHNLVVGYARHQSIREFYNGISWSLLLAAATRVSFVSAVQLLLFWELFLLALLLAEVFLNPAGALLAQPGGRRTYFLVLGKRIPVGVALTAGGAAFMGFLMMTNDFYQQSQNRKNNFSIASLHEDTKIKVAAQQVEAKQLELDIKQTELDIKQTELDIKQTELDIKKAEFKKAKYEALRAQAEKRSRWFLVLASGGSA